MTKNPHCHIVGSNCAVIFFFLSMQSTLSVLHLTASDCHSGAHVSLQIDEQSLFRCHIHTKPTTYIMAYKSPLMTIRLFQFINVKCSTFRSHEQLRFWKVNSEIWSWGLAVCTTMIGVASPWMHMHLVFAQCNEEMQYTLLQ